MDFNKMVEDNTIRKIFNTKPENNHTELLEEINKKLDAVLAHFGVPSAYIYTGKEVLDTFKKLNGVK